MEIISIEFAFFLIQLALVIVPIAFGIRLFVMPSEKKNELKTFMAKKLLGDEQLIKLSVFNIWLHSFASISFMFGIIFAIVFFL